jgi:glycerophosphoryl diester phosphodiesterase
LGRPFINWAHQGGAREAPSNTLFAFRTAVSDAGATGLELDVNVSSDHELVVCHDRKLGRISKGSERIEDLTAEALARVDAAYWWRPGVVFDHDGESAAYEHRGKVDTDPDFGISTLRRVLDVSGDVPLTIELKRPRFQAELAQLLGEHADRAVIIVSFNDLAIRRYRRIDPTADTAAGLARLLLFWLATRLRIGLGSGGHVALQAPAWMVDERFVHLAHRAELAVHAWTVDDPVEMERLLALGVDGIMTDRPSVLRHVLDG